MRTIAVLDRCVVVVLWCADDFRLADSNLDQQSVVYPRHFRRLVR